MHSLNICIKIFQYYSRTACSYDKSPNFCPIRIFCPGSIVNLKRRKCFVIYHPPSNGLIICNSLKVLGRLEYQYDCATHVELAQQLSFVHVRLLRQHLLLVVHVLVSAHLQTHPTVRLQALVHEYLHRSHICRTWKKWETKSNIN